MSLLIETIRLLYINWKMIFYSLMIVYEFDYKIFALLNNIKLIHRVCTERLKIINGTIKYDVNKIETFTQKAYDDYYK